MSKTLELDTLDGRKIEIVLRDFTVPEIMHLGAMVTKAVAENNCALSLDAIYQLVLKSAQSWKGARKTFSSGVLSELLDADLSLVMQICNQVNAIIGKRLEKAGLQTATDIEQPEDGVVH